MTFQIQNYRMKINGYHIIANLDDDLWFGECVELPHCVAQGYSLFEFMSEMQSAIEDYIASLRESGLRVPAPYPESISVGGVTAYLYSGGLNIQSTETVR